MAYSLPSVPYWQPKLGALGLFVTGLEDIAQTITVILGIQLGANPLRPELGCDLLSLIDTPQPRATALAIRRVTEAIERWEPRAKVSNVKFTYEGLGWSKVSVYWYPKGSTPSDSQETTVAVAGSSASSSASYVQESEVGAPSGVAPLNALGIVADDYLPKRLRDSVAVEVEIDGGEL